MQSQQSSRIARNVVLTLAAQLVSWCLSFAVNLVLPRYVQDSGLGAITLAWSTASLLSVIIGLGTSTALVKEIARDPTRLGSLVVAGIATRLPLGVIALGFCWLAVRLTHQPDSLQLYTILFMAAMVVGQTTDVLSSALRAVEDFPRVNAITLLEKALVSIGTIGLIFIRGPLWAIVGISVVAATISLILSAVSVAMHARNANVSLRPHIDASQIRSLLISGLPYMSSAIFMSIYGQTDPLILKSMSGVAEVGWYGLATRFAGSTMIIPTTLCATMLPMLARVYREDEARFDQIVRRLFNLMIVSVIPISAIFMFAPHEILRLLHYPATFEPSAAVFAVSGVGIVLYYLSQAAATVLIACDRQGVFGKLSGVAAIVSMPLCALGVWITQKWCNNGAVGAMASDVLLEIGLFAAYVACMPKGCISPTVGGLALRSILAALPMAILFRCARDVSTVYFIVLGLAVYAILCVMLRCVESSDLALLKGFIGRRSGAS